MEPQRNREILPKFTWEEIRELDELENWRDRNAIITKHQHQQNLSFIHNFVEILIDSAIDHSREQGECNNSHQQGLPDSNTREFDNLLTETEQKSESNQLQVLPSDNDFKPGSSFDFELSYFEQINSSEETKYVPRGSLFRTFDPLVSKSPVQPTKTHVTVPTCDPLTGEINSEIQIGDYRESTSSYCSCQTAIPDEVSGDGLTSGEEYDSTHEDNCELVTVPDVSLKGDKAVASPLHTSNMEPDDNNDETFDALPSDIFDTWQDQNTPTVQMNEEASPTLPIEPTQQEELHASGISSEEFRPSHEVDLAMEFLEGLNIGEGERGVPRESLFTRFDPLTQQSIPPSELIRRSSQLSDSSLPPNSTETPGKHLENANLLTFATPPKSQHMTPRASSSKLILNENSVLYNTNPLSLTKPVGSMIIPANTGSSDLESRSVLRYTDSEVAAITRGDRGRVRLEVRKRKKEKEEILAKEKTRLNRLLESEKKRWLDKMKKRESELHRVKDEEDLQLSSAVSKWAIVDGKYQAAVADVSLLRERKELLATELSVVDKSIASMEERYNELSEDTERLKVKKCKVVSELEDMTCTLSNFGTKISEATESIELNLSRINELIVKIDSTAKTLADSEKRFFRLEDRAADKLMDANKMHEESSKQYNQEMILMKTQIRTKKMQLSDSQLEIQKFESQNKSLEGIAEEMMAQHQLTAK